MKSPLRRVIVYDLETGGLNYKINSITEIAAAVIDLETLEIVEEFSQMLKPRLNLSNREEEPIREARLIFKNLSTKDPDSNIKLLKYKQEKLTLKTLDILADDIEDFYKYLDKNGNIISLEDYKKLRETKYSHIVELYFNYTYNPQALEVTHISKDMLIKEGLSFEEFFKNIDNLISRNTVGNNKPILAGHNIKNFDNAFLEKLFLENKKDLNKLINNLVIDTLEIARLRWFELSSFSLGVCANEMELTLKGAHRALADTLINAKLLIKFLENLRGEGSQKSTYKRRKYNFNF